MRRVSSSGGKARGKNADDSSQPVAWAKVSSTTSHLAAEPDGHQPTTKVLVCVEFRIVPFGALSS